MIKKFMLVKILSAAVVISGVLFALSLYYSDRRVSERDYRQMLASGEIELSVIENYLQHHEPVIDSMYNQAVQLAASQDPKHLDLVIDYYTTGRLILKTSTAQLILDRLPSTSIKINHAAGKIYATEEFNLYDPVKAVQLLEYAALRGDWNAAASLAKLYAKASCHVGAVTWAREANRRDITSECSSLPVNINLLSEDELDAATDNEIELARAEKEKRLPLLRYSGSCDIRPE